MRYTERKFDYNFGTVYDFIRMVFILIFVAPARLCYEITSKVIYLKKNQINLVLDTAFFLALGMIVVVNVINMITNKFSLYLGKFPLIFQLVTLVIIAVIDITFHLSDLVIYKQLDKLLPAITGATLQFNNDTEAKKDSPIKTNKESSEVTAEQLDEILNSIDLTNLDSSAEETSENTKKQEIKAENNDTINKKDSIEEIKLKDTVEDPINLDDYNLDSLLNDDIADNIEIKQYQEADELIVEDLLENGFKEVSDLSEEEKKTIESNLDESTDPSKFLDETILSMFAGKVDVDNYGIIETFNNWGVPDSFGMLT